MTDTMNDKWALGVLRRAALRTARLTRITDESEEERALNHIAARLAQPAEAVPEVTNDDVIAAWDAFEKNMAGRTMFAVLESYRARLIAPAQEVKG